MPSKRQRLMGLVPSIAIRCRRRTNGSGIFRFRRPAILKIPELPYLFPGLRRFWPNCGCHQGAPVTPTSRIRLQGLQETAGALWLPKAVPRRFPRIGPPWRVPEAHKPATTPPTPMLGLAVAVSSLDISSLMPDSSRSGAQTRMVRPHRDPAEHVSSIADGGPLHVRPDQ